MNAKRKKKRTTSPTRYTLRWQWDHGAGDRSLVSARPEKVKVITPKKERTNEKKSSVANRHHTRQKKGEKKNSKEKSESFHTVEQLFRSFVYSEQLWGYCRDEVDCFLFPHLFSAVSSFAQGISSSSLSLIYDLLVIIFYLENHLTRLRCFLMTAFHFTRSISLLPWVQATDGPVRRRKDEQQANLRILEKMETNRCRPAFLLSPVSASTPSAIASRYAFPAFAFLTCEEICICINCSICEHETTYAIW